MRPAAGPGRAVSGAAIMLTALALDVALGWPSWLFARIGHPVTWLGRLVTALDARLNDAQRRGAARRRLGAIAAISVVALVALAAALVTALLPDGAAGILLAGVCAWPLLAARSLHEHVADVVRPLAHGDSAAARLAVARIVGRDPALLDDAGIARAALESLAENASDGVVAPVFWGVLFGLPGIAAYKAVNTLDSMWGHRTERYRAFGWAAARIDDAANWVPARLTAILVAGVSARPARALVTMRRDAWTHRSPNAGWPEAAMAGALGVRLSGPRRYAGHVADEPWINAGCPDPTAEDTRQGLALYRRAMLTLAGALAFLAL